MGSGAKPRINELEDRAIKKIQSKQKIQKQADRYEKGQGLQCGLQLVK